MYYHYRIFIYLLPAKIVIYNIFGIFMFIRGVFEIILVASIVNISHSQLNTIQETGTMNLQMG